MEFGRKPLFEVLFELLCFIILSTTIVCAAVLFSLLVRDYGFASISVPFTAKIVLCTIEAVGWTTVIAIHLRFLWVNLFAPALVCIRYRNSKDLPVFVAAVYVLTIEIIGWSVAARVRLKYPLRVNFSVHLLVIAILLIHACRRYRPFKVLIDHVTK